MTSSFVEPASHRLARSFLGPSNFHGIDAVEKYVGPLSDAEREALLPLRIRDHRTGEFLTEEQTLQVIEACAGTHVLVAVRPGMSLVGLHAACKAGFYNDTDRPWFAEPGQRPWAAAATADPWLLVRKGVVPGSTGKSVAAQQDHLARDYPNERFLSPAEFCLAALLHFKETGERLCPDHVVRFPMQTAEGGWVHVDWFGVRLNVYNWSGDAGDDVGACSARTS